jgi:putative endonuclease
MRMLKPDHRQSLGKSGEDYACHELERRGYAILARRHRTRFGEIDIIAMDEGVLVFIEVRTRRTATCGTAAESVGWRKQHRLQRLATAYLAANRLAAQPCRFDVVTVRWPADRDGDRGTPEIALLKNAFETRSAERW